MGTRSLIMSLFASQGLRYDGEIWIGGLTQCMAVFDCSPQMVRVSVSRMTKDGWLTQRRVGQRSFYSLTQSVRSRIDEAIPRLYGDRLPWDGYWRMLILSVPVGKRNLRERLRRHLLWVGLAPMGNSVWITPNSLEHQLNSLVKEYQLSGHSEIFRSHHLGPATERDAPVRYFDLDRVSRIYLEWISVHEPQYLTMLRDLAAGRPASDRDMFRDGLLLIHGWRKFLHIDPWLPKELLPGDWPGFRAQTLFREYNRLLSPGAERFFDNVAVRDSYRSK